mgnify:CR=1 FL=1
MNNEMIVKKTGKKVNLVEKKYFPLRFLCDDGNIYFTYDIKDLIDIVYKFNLILYKMNKEEIESIKDYVITNKLERKQNIFKEIIMLILGKILANTFKLVVGLTI